MFTTTTITGLKLNFHFEIKIINITDAVLGILTFSRNSFNFEDLFFILDINSF